MYSANSKNLYVYSVCLTFEIRILADMLLQLIRLLTLCYLHICNAKFEFLQRVHVFDMNQSVHHIILISYYTNFFYDLLCTAKSNIRSSLTSTWISEYNLAKV